LIFLDSNIPMYLVGAAHPHNRLYRTTKLLEIGAGTTEIRKPIIAEELLRER
jgi:alkylation response protein AidB-like acyl-CoA dehydrogenase